MKRFLLFLALGGTGLLAATAVSMASGHPATDTNPAIVAAGETCKGQGLKPGSDAFKACVQNLVKTNKTRTSTNPASTNPAVVAAGKTCKGQGLTPGSDAFKACVHDIVTPSETKTNAHPDLQAAQQACKAQGLTPGSDAFKQCVKQQLGK